MGLLETIKKIEEEEIQMPKTISDAQAKMLIRFLKESNSNLIGEIVFRDNEIETEEKTLTVVSGFHAEKIINHKEPDEYFAGLRANHFSVEIGWSEFSDLEDIIIIVTANHKGTRISKVWKV